MEQTSLRNLLLACLRTVPPPTLAADLAQLSPDDWQQLLQLSQQQQIAPLLYHRLKEHQLGALVAPEVHEKSHQIQLHNSVRNMRIHHELRQIATALYAAQLPCIILKGAYLAMAVYPNPVLRCMVDLDLLVHQRDLPAVITVLQQAGYEPETPILLDAHLKTDHHLPPFRHPQRLASVEIHWTITTPNQTYTIDIAEFWAEAKAVSQANVPAQAFSPEDLLLHICVHATYHHRFAQSVRYLCDIDAIVAHYAGLDWQTVITRAKKRNWAKGVCVALHLAQQLLGTAIPAPVSQALWSTPLPTTIIETTLAEMFEDKAKEPILSANFVDLWQALQSMERTQSKTLLRRILVSRIMLPGTSAVSHRSPKEIFYFLVRLGDLLMRYSGKFWQLWRGTSPLGVRVARNHTLSQWLDQATE